MSSAALGGAASGAAAGMAFGPWGALIGAGVGFGLSALSASGNNSALSRSMNSTVAQSQKSLEAIQFQTSIAAQKYANDSRRARGSIRVAAAGAGMSGSDLMALQRQAAFDADLNTRIAKADAQHKIEQVRAQTMATLAGLANGMKSPLLSGVEGGIGGAVSGYSIGNMFNATPTTAASGSGGWQSALGAT